VSVSLANAANILAAMTTSLPTEVQQVFERFITTEYTTIDGSGQPITWPVTPYYSAGDGAIDLTTGLGLTGLIVSPAFGYAGVGFPVVGMNAFAQTWGALLPLRWYMAVLLGQAARGLPLSESARPFAALAGLAVLYSLLALLRPR